MSRQYRIYIAGKVTGEAYQPTFEKFCSVEMMLRKLGQETVNPMRLVSRHMKDWSTAMKICLPQMLECDAIYLLPDWHNSRGARLEYLLANELGFKLITDEQLQAMRKELQLFAAV